MLSSAGQCMNAAGDTNGHVQCNNSVFNGYVRHLFGALGSASTAQRPPRPPPVAAPGVGGEGGCSKLQCSPKIIDALVDKTMTCGPYTHTQCAGLEMQQAHDVSPWHDGYNVLDCKKQDAMMLGRVTMSSCPPGPLSDACHQASPLLSCLDVPQGTSHGMRYETVALCMHTSSYSLNDNR